ncbi:response regulator transcription factor [Anaeromyxobacter dehalogenans]|uniref:Phosphate regulon transcriptional regulatory protein PhoB n=1 Tax=Anaeromyxobacter dehalogenans (strain 2CP-C) TaxID=290397 RepID=Q2IN07_ANADE|nr:response regulator transcription factor [Anaeromyxobacter dehalogenans]ABC80187.1 two component transcriptional regulator, winged helix family [Anaeromyxobacter dehalogenans 2CP-C]
MAERILVIEDDPSILRGLQLNLGMEGYTVRSASDGETGLQLARTEQPDLVVVDVMLPRMGGLEVIREIRKEDPELPILILSAKNQETDKVAGLQLGADDYLGKPFGLKELLARIDALLRRRRSRGEGAQPKAIRRAGEIELDLDARRALVDGRALELTSREFDLLAFFVTHPDRVYSREQLMEAVWGSRYFGTARTVDNFVARLRAHIGDDAEQPRHLETVRGIGYRFNV